MGCPKLRAQRACMTYRAQVNCAPAPASAGNLKGLGPQSSGTPPRWARGGSWLFWLSLTQLGPVSITVRKPKMKTIQQVDLDQPPDQNRGYRAVRRAEFDQTEGPEPWPTCYYHPQRVIVDLSTPERAELFSEYQSKAEKLP